MTNTPPEFATMKARLKEIWMDGDFGQIAVYGEYDAERFVGRRNIKPGMKVLDVACGTGNLAIPAAQTGATVTGVDIAANLLEQGRTRAEGLGLTIQFDEGDAEELPYPDAAFDLVMTIWGAMFAPRPDYVASELLRVCRPGGQIAMGNWTASGWVGTIGKTIAGYAPPPPNSLPPTLWGDEQIVRERLGPGVSDIQFDRIIGSIKLPFSPSETLGFYCQYYGPFKRTLAALPDDKQTALLHDLVQLGVNPPAVR